MSATPVVTATDVILVVDDNPANIKVLFDCLRRAGFKVLVARDGLSALEKLRETSTSLVLLDVMMPGLDGFATCRQMRADSRTSEVPVIFLTALNDTDSKVRGLELGAVDYITKPFHHEEVLSRVRLHLKLRSLSLRLQQQNQALSQEVSARKAAETSLRQLNQNLEAVIQARTQDLAIALQDLREREEELHFAAYHDALTQLPNRAWVMGQLETFVRGEEPYSVFFIDLDYFKNVNDRAGHVVGDRLLQSVAKRLSQQLNATVGASRAVLARLGGDEFIALVQGLVTPERLTAIAGELIEQLRRPFQLERHHLLIGGSIGIISSDMGYQVAADILRDVDVAMYEAKRLGRGCYVLLTPELRDRALERLNLESDLQQGIAQQEFSLAYQPIVRLSTQSIAGFEALLRWHSPRRGLVSPSQFIPLAEETGWIDNLDRWALETACRQLGHWQQHFGPQLALDMNVNLSVVRLQRHNLLDHVEALLGEVAGARSALKLEITESCLLDSDANSLATLESLSAAGIRLCIDDFGTGYSSLSRLHSFPVHTLKIDRAFISRLDYDRGGRKIVETIVALADTLGLEVVAEGIETPEQLRELQALGCDLVQGFLFSPPLTAAAATELLRQQAAGQGHEMAAVLEPLRQGRDSA
mgnify:CR=1 FL=1